MSVTFVIGRSGSGKTHRCFSRIVDALRADPLGPPIFWLLPRQATFVSERRLTCASGLEGFCRAQVLSFDQLGQRIFTECGGAAVPEVTAIGRQMILGHLLRKHGPKLQFFRSIERQAGLAAELDATFDELERSGKSSSDLATLLDELSHSGPLDIEGQSLRRKLQDVRLLYDAYLSYLGQDRLDQHRRLAQVLQSVKSCSFIPRSTFYVDGFFEFTDHERRMLGALAAAGAKMEITLLMDPDSAMLKDPHPFPEEMDLFHRTETTYRRLWFTFAETNVTVLDPILLRKSRRFESPMLERVEKQMFDVIRDTGVPPVPKPRRVENHIEKSTSPVSGASSTGGTPVSRHRGGDDHGIEFVERIEAPDRAAEVDAVARRVHGLLAQGYRLRDIAILVRSIEKYHAPLAASFEEHGISFFVDRRRSASHHPLLQFVRCALQAARFDYQHDAVIAMLKTGLAGLSFDEADELENYALLHRVRGLTWESPEPWVWRRDLLCSDEDGAGVAPANPMVIDQLRRRIADPLAPLVKLLRGGSAIPLKTIATELFAALERFGVRRTLDRWISAGASTPAGTSMTTASRLEARGEHEQVWNRLCELFDQMVDLLGTERVAPTDFVDIVESGFERLELAITPPTVDQVLVGQADRTRCPPVKAVFVMGLCEAEFPMVPRETTVLSDRERRELRRRKLDLDPDGQRQLLDERLLGYAAFTQASQHLILTRPQGDDAGRPIAASVFWQRIGEMFSGVPTQTIRRAAVGKVSQISTPRQLVSGLMGWIRGGAGEKPSLKSPCSADRRLTPTFSAEHAEEATGTEESWRSLYHWLIASGDENPAIGPMAWRAWRSLTYSNEAVLSPAAPALAAAPLAVNVARLETMAACPFKHFVRHALKLLPRERPDVSGADLGQVYHRLLERLVARALRRSDPTAPDPFAISAEAIHSTALQVAKSLRGELLLSTARNRYLLQRVERTLADVIASQKAMLNHTRYRPAYTGVSFGSPSESDMGSLAVTTPAGKKVFVRGRIDRIDTMSQTGDAIVYDYRTNNQFLSLDRVYHGLSLQLVACLAALQAGAQDLGGIPLTPTGAFYLRLLRPIEDVKHPDQAPDPADEKSLLKFKPRGIFDSRAMDDIQPDFETGRSLLVAATKKKDGEFGDARRSDNVSSDVFRAVLDLVVRRIGELGDQVLANDISIAPFRLKLYSPCSHCEFRGVCRFETSVNRYRHLQTLERDEVIQRLREEAPRGQ